MKRRLTAILAFFLTTQLILGRVPTNWFVAKNGDDTHSGAIGAPFLTIAHARDSALCGDTIMLRGSGVGQGDGDWHESVTITNMNAAMCSSWGNPITLQNYQSEPVTWHPTNSIGDANLVLGSGNGELAQYDIYWIIRSDTLGSLFLDGRPNTGDTYHAVCKGIFGMGGAGRHVKFENLEGAYANTDAFGGGSHDTEDIWLINSHLHHNGGPYNEGGTPTNCTNVQDHQIYWDGSGLTVKGGEYDHSPYTGIQQFNSGQCVMGELIDCENDNLIDGVYAHDNFAAGVSISVGYRNRVINSLLTANGFGVAADYRCHDCGAFNNTVANNTNYGICTGCGGGGGSVPDGFTAKGNLFWGNGGTAFIDLGTGTDCQYNLNGGSDCTHNTTGDPLFTNAGAGDYILQSMSPAKNCGFDVHTLSIVALFLDKLGVARPNGSAADCGAYQTPIAPPPTSGNASKLHLGHKH